jgi:hypothetical protein
VRRAWLDLLVVSVRFVSAAIIAVLAVFDNAEEGKEE